MNHLGKRYLWTKVLKGPIMRVSFNWVGINVDSVKFCYLSLFIRYFYGFKFLYTNKVIGRDNKKIFYILKGEKVYRKDLVNLYMNTKEELIPYLSKSDDFMCYLNKKDGFLKFYLKSLEIIFNKRLSNRFALFFPIMNLKFVIDFKFSSKNVNIKALENV